MTARGGAGGSAPDNETARPPLWDGGPYDFRVVTGDQPNRLTNPSVSSVPTQPS